MLRCIHTWENIPDAWLQQVGSDPTEAEVQAVKEHAKQHRGQVKVVQGDWLRQCGQQRRLLPAVGAFLIPMATLTAPSSSKPTSSSPRGVGNRGLQHPHGVGVECCELDGASVAEEKQNGGPTASQAPVNQALKGYW